MKFHNPFSKSRTKVKDKPKIIIDHREKNSLVPSHLKKHFHIEYKQLPVADYIFNNIAIERKTIQDLKSSIVNKRIFQQLLELKQYPNHFIIVEGKQEDLYQGVGVHENALRGFFLAVALEFQTPIIFTQNEEDTAYYIHILSKKKSTPQSIRASKIYLTKKEQLQFILEGFPNIGPVAAKKLLKRFKTIKKLTNATIEDLQKIIGKKADDFYKLINKKY